MGGHTDSVKRNVIVDTEAPAATLFDVVSNLDTYPEWLDIVSSVEVADPHADDEGPAWYITLRAQLGRFARSKRLRIVLIATDPGSKAIFARRERDDRDHADWDMVAIVSSIASSGADANEGEDAGGSGSRLELDLSYSGGLWSNVLDAVLGDEVDQALERLPAYALSHRA